MRNSKENISFLKLTEKESNECIIFFIEIKKRVDGMGSKQNFIESGCVCVYLCRRQRENELKIGNPIVEGSLNNDKCSSMFYN